MKDPAPRSMPSAQPWLPRAIRTLFVERRLPYRLSVACDKLCNKLGRTRKTIRIDGGRMVVRRLTCDEVIIRSIMVRQDYTPTGFDIRPADTVIDIGGNIGAFALLASRCAFQGKVFTFEPNRENYELLLRNIRLNQRSNIVPVHAAVSGARGKVQLHCTAQGGFHGLRQVPERSYVASETVDALTLRDIFDDYGIEKCHFLKLDCEGSEYEILEHTPDEYWSRIQRIAMEYHETTPEEGDRRIESLVSRLKERGFRIEEYSRVEGFVNGIVRAQR